jgi:hypothetical protein
MPSDIIRLQKIMKGALVVVLAGLAAAFILDFAYFKVRMLHPKPADPLETFTAPRLLAIAEKGNKVDYEIDSLNPEQTLVCSHSIFPQGGSQPCWYLKPKSQKPIPM